MDLQAFASKIWILPCPTMACGAENFCSVKVIRSARGLGSESGSARQTQIHQLGRKERQNPKVEDQKSQHLLSWQRQRAFCFNIPSQEVKLHACTWILMELMGLHMDVVPGSRRSQYPVNPCYWSLLSCGNKMLRSVSMWASQRSTGFWRPTLLIFDKAKELQMFVDTVNASGII